MAVEEDVFTTSSYSITSLTGTAVTIKLSGSWIAKQINGNLGPGVFIVNKASGGVINATVSYASMSGTTTATITGEGLSPETEYAIPECAGFIFYDNSRLDIPTRIEFTTASVTPTEDESYLNERGLAHFWENIDTLKQDKLTAGTNIAISANNTISASQPTVGNATLTIQKNGTSAGTFTANATSNKTINITVPTKTSDITNDSGFVTSSVVDGYAKTADLATVATSGSYNDLSNKPTIPAAQVQSNWTQTTTTAADYIKNKPTLATVATSGSYNDLSNKPTIPTVNNATLTIQKNGATVKTFTANASSNVTANITVPTTVAELSDASIYVTAEDIASTSALTPPVQTNMIADGAVTSDKIDWSTFNSNGLPTADGSATRSGVGTVYYKKIMPKLFLLWGSITPVYDDNAIALPFSSAMSGFSQVFTLYGAGMNSTKAYISPGSSSIGFTKQTTGNNYALWALAALNG